MPDSFQSSKVRILIVEDDHINRSVFLKQLQRMEYDVAAVENGLEAADYCLEQSVDMILMDCAMPVMDGYEATARIRQEQRQQGYEPIIIGITASMFPGDRQKCLAAGMDDYLPKPVYTKDLKAVLKKWLERTTVSA